MHTTACIPVLILVKSVSLVTYMYTTAYEFICVIKQRNSQFNWQCTVLAPVPLLLKDKTGSKIT